MTHGSRVRRVAARIGSAEFFEPLTLILPESGWPPWTRILSIPSEEEPCHTGIILSRRNVVVIVLGQKSAERLDLADSELEREHSARFQMRRRSRDQPANDF